MDATAQLVPSLFPSPFEWPISTGGYCQKGTPTPQLIPVTDLCTVQLEEVLNFPHITVGNKTEWKGLKFLTPLWFPPFFGGNTAMKIQVRFLRSSEWDCSGVNHSYVLCLAKTEWKGFYSQLWVHPFGWKHSGTAGGSQCAGHRS